MAKTISTSNHKAFHVLGLFSILLLIQKSSAYEFKVGGSNGWAVPSNSNALSYNQWAETSRFQIGDTLLFVYHPENNDSVLHVSEEDYTNCNTATYLQKYSDGHTVFQLNHAGHYYFISGVKDNCLKNQKMVVVVMADRSNKSSSSNQTSVASSPPSPAPTGDESPPWGTVQIVPSPAPATEQTPSPPPPPPPPSGASSVVFFYIGSIGALVGSSLILVF
ncbi:early nodulin-like protein 9 [Cornus florida]|uniref:early nodulin-like protein 9 n=1 Tax=Cornus florida TaxID=4283 RepID=UPI00289EE7AE|nr:early nodulin-like protein 9 [Cornus florida]